MTRSPNFLSFPDVNVWLALATSEHVHHEVAKRWWNEVSGRIAFTRITQIGFLRLATTAAAMDGKPVTMLEAWEVYDRFFTDDRVVFLGEQLDAEREFRNLTSTSGSSPRLWSDAWLLATASSFGGVLVTLDAAPASRGAHRLG